MEIKSPDVYVDAIKRLEATKPSYNDAFNLFWEDSGSPDCKPPHQLFERSTQAAQLKNAIKEFNEEVVPQITMLKEALKVSEAIFVANLIIENM